VLPQRRSAQRRPAGAGSSLQLGLGIAAVALGGVGLLLGVIPAVGLVAGLIGAGLGLVLGVVALLIARARQGQGMLFPLIGSGTSVLGLAITFILWIAVYRPAAEAARTAELQEADRIREAARQQTAKNNLAQIGLALHTYHDAYRALPPAAILSKDGKPLLSWRVAILPFIEQGPLAQQFRTDEPWDSPHNLKLLPQMPPLYAPVGVTTKEAHATFYRGFVPAKGNRFKTAWQTAPRGMRMIDFRDGLEHDPGGGGQPGGALDQAGRTGLRGDEGTAQPGWPVSRRLQRADGRRLGEILIAAD